MQTNKNSLKPGHLLCSTLLVGLIAILILSTLQMQDLSILIKFLNSVLYTLMLTA